MYLNICVNVEYSINIIFTFSREIVLFCQLDFSHFKSISFFTVLVSVATIYRKPLQFAFYTNVFQIICITNIDYLISSNLTAWLVETSNYEYLQCILCFHIVKNVLLAICLTNYRIYQSKNLENILRKTM